MCRQRSLAVAVSRTSSSASVWTVNSYTYTMRQATTFVVGLAAVRISGFVPRLGVPTRTWPSFPRSTDVAPSSPPLLRVMASTPKAPLAAAVDPHEKQPQQQQQQQRPWHRLWRRLDTIKSSGLKEEVQTAGLGQRIKNLHNPITYLVLSLLAGLRWEWCFRSPYYWFGVAFLIKWYVVWGGEGDESRKEGMCHAYAFVNRSRARRTVH